MALWTFNWCYSLRPRQGPEHPGPLNCRLGPVPTRSPPWKKPSPLLKDLLASELKERARWGQGALQDRAQVTPLWVLLPLPYPSVTWQDLGRTRGCQQVPWILLHEALQDMDVSIKCVSPF